MKLVFMGTPDFAVPSLEILARSSHEIIAVVTAPDKPRGRGRKVRPTPVKQRALELGLHVLQPETLRDAEFQAELSSMHPDVIVVVAFRILPREVFTIPSRGSFNLHASLLPKYRGAAPINWALIKGEKETGVTTFFLEEKVDTGNIILQKRVPVPPDMTAGELHDVLMRVGAEAVMETVDMISAGTVALQPQDASRATPAPKIFRETCRIDWTLPAGELHDFIRGLSPYPGAWTTLDSREMKILRSKRVEEPPQVALGPGVLAVVGKETLLCGTGSGTLEILELKAPGSRMMTAGEYLRGHPLAPGARFQ